MNELSKMANPPPLIVTFRLADERVWAEVLNQPSEAREVLRIVDQAWQRWKWLEAVAAGPRV